MDGPDSWESDDERSELWFAESAMLSPGIQ